MLTIELTYLMLTIVLTYLWSVGHASHSKMHGHGGLTVDAVFNRLFKFLLP
jgi:hypothetical protein